MSAISLLVDFILGTLLLAMEEFTVFVGGLNFRKIEMSFSLMGLIFRATGYICILT